LLKDGRGIYPGANIGMGCGYDRGHFDTGRRPAESIHAGIPQKFEEGGIQGQPQKARGLSGSIFTVDQEPTQFVQLHFRDLPLSTCTLGCLLEDLQSAWPPPPYPGTESPGGLGIQNRTAQTTGAVR